MDEKALEGNFDVTCKTVTEDYGVLGLAGPKSRDIMSKLVSNDVSNEAFPFLTVQDCTIGGVPVKAFRISYTGECLSLGICCENFYIIRFPTQM